MNGRRAAVGLALLWALLFSAFSAPSAWAVNGTTAYTCKPEKIAGAGFEDAHCTKATGANAGFVHQSIMQDATTTIHITNEKTTESTAGSWPFTLRAKGGGGVEYEIVCEKVFGHSNLINRLNATTKEHWVEGGKTTLHLTDCKVNKPTGCVIPGKTILIEELKMTTQGQGDKILLESEGKEEIVPIKFEKCDVALFDGEHVLAGKTQVQTAGATVAFEHKEIAKMTDPKTLFFSGIVAAIEGRLTISQAEKTEETAKKGNPISFTTVT